MLLVGVEARHDHNAGIRLPHYRTCPIGVTFCCSEHVLS